MCFTLTAQAFSSKTHSHRRLCALKEPHPSAQCKPGGNIALERVLVEEQRERV